MRTSYNDFTEEIPTCQEIIDLYTSDTDLYASIKDYYSRDCDGSFEFKSMGYCYTREYFVA